MMAATGSRTNRSSAKRRSKSRPPQVKGYTVGNMNARRFQQAFDGIVDNVETVIKGKTDVVRLALVAILCEGHILFEDLPGKAVALKIAASEIFRERQQREMIKLYQENGVNPLASCFPFLLQIPFFIALYWVLLSSVEMRNAPWIGWIHDLSAMDPYYILPLLMTGSTLFQTWLNPTPPDPMQAKMFMIMPVVFTFLFLNFPSGLVIYWLVNNVLSILQQWHINRVLERANLKPSGKA